MTDKSSTSDEIAVQYESRLLGSLLINPSQFDEVSDIVGFDDFIGPNHMLIFQTIGALSLAKEAIHALSVSENISRTCALMGQAAPVSIADLQAMATIASPLGGKSDATKVQERSNLRRLSDAGQRIKESADNATADPDVIVDSIREIVEQTSQAIEARGAARQDNFIPYKSAMEEYITNLSALSENPDVYDGIRTGIEDIDAYLEYLPAGMHVLAARPGGGKTALANAIITGAYETTDRGDELVGCLFQSMDMTLPKLMMRIMALKSGVPISALRTGRLDELQWTLVSKALTEMQDFNGRVWFDPTRGVTTSDFRARVRRYVREKRSRNGVVVVDYLQQMTPPAGARLGTRRPADYVSQAISDIAKEFGVVCITLAQLNRNLESRANKRPILSDLKDSGQIEQDADSIFFLHRDPQTPDLVEFIAAKNREGEPNHTVDLGFSGAKQQFYKVEQRSAEERHGGGDESHSGGRQQAQRTSGFSRPPRQH